MSEENIEESNRIYYKHLFTDPVTFFKRLSMYSSDDLLYFVIWSVGISGVLSRLDSQINKNTSNSFLHSILTGGWWELWVFVLAVGIVGGIISYYFNGLLFGIRLLWSKAEPYTYADVRKKTAYLKQIEALPHILLVIVMSLIFKNYYTYYSKSLWDFLILLPFIIFRWRNSYIVARDFYGADKKRSLFWFVIIPSVMMIAGSITIMITLLNK